MFATDKTHSKTVCLLIVISCLLVQGTLAQNWQLLIKSDGNEKFGNGRSYTVSSDRFEDDLKYKGVKGVWSQDPEDADDDQKATMTEQFRVTCGSRLRLRVLGDDEFTAYINGQRVLAGKQWDKVEETTVNIDDAKYNIVRCEAAGKNTLRIDGVNDDGDASIAFTLEEDQQCKKCNSGYVFNSQLCRCAILGTGDAGSSATGWNYLKDPIPIYNKPINFNNRDATTLSSIQYPANAKPTQLLITASVQYFTLNNGVPERNMIKFYQDHENDNNSANDHLEYVMMLYRRSQVLSSSNYQYQTQQTFALDLAENENLHVQPSIALSPNSNLNLDIIGWR